MTNSTALTLFAFPLAPGAITVTFRIEAAANGATCAAVAKTTAPIAPPAGGGGQVAAQIFDWLARDWSEANTADYSGEWYNLRVTSAAAPHAVTDLPIKLTMAEYDTLALDYCLLAGDASKIFCGDRASLSALLLSLWVKPAKRTDGSCYGPRIDGSSAMIMQDIPRASTGIVHALLKNSAAAYARISTHFFTEQRTPVPEESKTFGFDFFEAPLQNTPYDVATVPAAVAPAKPALSKVLYFATPPATPLPAHTTYLTYNSPTSPAADTSHPYIYETALVGHFRQGVLPMLYVKLEPAGFDARRGYLSQMAHGATTVFGNPYPDHAPGNRQEGGPATKLALGTITIKAARSAEMKKTIECVRIAATRGSALHTFFRLHRALFAALPLHSTQCSPSLRAAPFSQARRRARGCSFLARPPSRSRPRLSFSHIDSQLELEQESKKSQCRHSSAPPPSRLCRFLGCLSAAERAAAGYPGGPILDAPALAALSAEAAKTRGSPLFLIEDFGYIYKTAARFRPGGVLLIEDPPGATGEDDREALLPNSNEALAAQQDAAAVSLMAAAQARLFAAVYEDVFGVAPTNNAAALFAARELGFAHRQAREVFFARGEVVAALASGSVGARVAAAGTGAVAVATDGLTCAATRPVTALAVNVKAFIDAAAHRVDNACPARA